MKSLAAAILIYLHTTHVVLSQNQSAPTSLHNAGNSSLAKTHRSDGADAAALKLKLVKAPGWKHLDEERCGLEWEKAQGLHGGSSKRHFSGRIFGGFTAKSGQFPWMVRVLYGYGRFKFAACGGALISKKHVITAAHCVDENLSQVKAGTGRHTQTLPVRKIIIHANYDEDKTDFDIALLILGRDAVINEYVGTVCLPLSSLATGTFGGQKGVVAGWGKTETKEASDVLLMVEVPILENTRCRKLGPFFQVKPFQMCAGGEAGKDSCQGDSGGPLMVKDKASQKYTVAGVVSYGYGCGRRGMPGVYTRVTYFLPWILNNMT